MRNFDDVPVEEDTRIKSRKLLNIDGLDARYEKWFWDGIYGESLIFYSEDIVDLSDEALKVFVTSSQLVNDTKSMTVKREEKYTFVNFNFRS